MDDYFDKLKEGIKNHEDYCDKGSRPSFDVQSMLYQTAKVLIEKITHLENEIEELKRRQNVHR